MEERTMYIAWRFATFAVLLTASIVMVLMWLAFKRKVATLASSPKKELPDSSTPPPEASLRDDVTDLYNRKHLLQRLQENMARCDRENERLALILWDIEGFVDFNNRFGQKEGDKLLSKVAETLRRCIRVYDEAFRCGPDEFCTVLLPGSEAVAAEVTDRVGQAMANNLFLDAEYADHKFSLTHGIVFYPSDNKMPEALLHAAGQALYRSRLASHPEGDLQSAQPL